jgi:hypothetical protein
MKAVVLDTNAGWSDVLLRGPAATALLESRKDVDLEVVIPEVVILETIKQYPDRAKKAQAAAFAARRELLALGLAASEPAEGGHETPFADIYRQRLTSVGVRVAPHPDPLPAVRWSVERRRPFKETGVGFPDAVIWLTVLAIASEFDEVLFITQNVHDFGDPVDPTELAPELKADLAERGLPSSRVRIVRSIREALPPDAEAHRRALTLLVQDATRRNLVHSLGTALQSATLPSNGLELGFPLDNDPTIGWLDINEIELVEARDLDQGVVGLELDLIAEASLEMFIFKGDVYSLDYKPEVSVIDYSWSDHYLLAEATISLDLRVEADVDADGEVVGSVAITSAERRGTGPR